MDKKLLIAMIGGIVSLLVAVVSLATALVTQKRAVASSLELERLKQSLAESAARATASRERHQSTVKVLHDATHAIQLAKDDLAIIMNAMPDTIDRRAALQTIEKSRARLVDCYATSIGFLVEGESRALHAAKNTMLNVEAHLRGAATDGTDEVLLDEDRKQLMSARAALSERQNVLRDFILRRVV